MTNDISFIDKITGFIKNSVTLKLVTITILMLLLLIPASMIQSIIGEREYRSEDVIKEVSSKWAGEQLINGPILTIPVIYEQTNENEKVIITRFWHLLPETLNINGTITPETLKRGIYEVVVYNSRLGISGNFVMESQPDPQDLKEIQFDKAFLTIAVSDLRGIKNDIHLVWNSEDLQIKPGSRIPGIVYSGVTVDLPEITSSSDQPISFDYTLEFNGSKTLSFIPIGKTTEVKLTSSWNSPSFDGNFLPDQREVTEQGFSAHWSILQINRNYPQSWTGDLYKDQLQASSFGVEMLLPVDNYQRSYRAAKYAVMTIALTFLVFFLVEILNRRKVHPFQYAMVGFALCLFYVLLVSLAEHMDFNLAYIISTVAIVSIIALYSISVFKKLKLTTVLVAMLCAIYGFVFVTLQLADYALLLGSIGLTAILALTMYFTRNINWYQLNLKSD